MKIIRIFSIIIACLILNLNNAYANSSELSEVYRIGITKFNNYSVFSNASDLAAEGFAMMLPLKLNVKADIIDETVGLSNKQGIVEIAKSNKADAILTGNVKECTIKRNWLGGQYAKVTLEVSLYSGKNGEILWKNSVTERSTGNSDILILQSASRHAIEKMVKDLMSSGLQGRFDDISKPTIEVIGENFTPTSVYLVRGYVKDNYEVKSLSVNDIKVPVKEDGYFEYPIEMNTSKLSVLLKAEDESNNVTKLEVNPVQIGHITGKIAQIIGDSIYISIGANQGVQKEMVFTVMTTDIIKEPTTGKVLDKIQRPLGYLKVIEVKPSVSVAKLLDNSVIGNVKIGDIIY